jgi:hypothetical protein
MNASSSIASAPFDQLDAQLGDPVDPLVVVAGGKLEAGLDLVVGQAVPRGVLVLFLPDVADVRHQVEHADEFVVAADRHLAQQGVGAEALADAGHAMRKFAPMRSILLT